MAVNLSPLGGAGAQFFTNDGVPLSGGLLYTYLAGTSTPATTYTSSSGITALANPIILDAAGRVPTGEIWLTDGISYKFVLKDSTDVLIATWDGLSGINSNFIAFTAQEETATATAGQTVFNTTLNYIPGTNNLAVYVNGSNQIVDVNYLETDDNTVTFLTGLNVGDVVKFSTATPVATNATTAANVSYTPAGASAITTTVQAKLRETVSVKDFGAVGNGTTDDTTAIQNALNASYDVYVPIGTYLISSTITVPAHTKLHFAGGLGNTSGSYPQAHLIKKSTMTTVGISIASTGWVDGGGLICQTGNTGDGVLLAGNSAKLSNFLVHGAGNDGVRVGTGVASQNTNSCELDRVTSQYNTRHGIFLNDGTGAAGSNTNCCTLIQPFCQYNGGDGIQIKEGFWNTIINPLCEVNSGWGIYLSGVLNNGLPSCRQTQVIGGDAEVNTLGNYWDGSYFSNWIGPASAVTLDPTGYYGNSFDRNQNIVRGLTSDGYAISANIVAQTTTQYPLVAEHKSTAAGGRGVGIKLKGPAGTGSGNTSRDSGFIVSGQRVGVANNYDAMTFSVNVNGVMTPYLFLDPFYSFIGPATDNTLSSGEATVRWTTIYAVTGTINTSDANQKQDVKSLGEKELAVAKAIKGLIKKFKFKDAVTAKGDNARIHVGVIAQEVQSAFEAEGLDATEYALFCSDTLEDGTTQLGIRYEELLAFVIASL
jgi:hypothetical protein